jgi:copper transport protein
MSRRLFAAVLLGLVVVLAGPATPASAHAALVRTSPVQNKIVDQAPAEIVVTFTEHVTLVRDKIQVVGPDGRRIDRGSPEVTGDDLRIPVRTDVLQGTYLVSYRVISADSHPVGAAFTYSFGVRSANAPRPAESGAGRTPWIVAISIAAARYLGFVGLILLAGPVLALTALWPRRLPRRGPTRLAFLGLGLIGLSTLLELYLQIPYSNGGGFFAVSGAAAGDLLASSYGRAHLVRLGVLALAALPLRAYLAGRAGKPVQAGLAILAVIGVATWPISGHPATTTAPLLTIVADAAHLTSMAIWLGGLVMLFGFVLRRARPKELDAILPVWSNWAALAVTVLVLAGTAQALINVATLTALLHTTYGGLLLFKIGILAAVLAVAAVSRRIVQGKALGVPQLRRTVFLEIVGAVLVLGLTSALVQTTPARTALTAATEAADPNTFDTTLRSKLYQLQIDISPLAVGNSDVHLFAFTPAGAPLDVKEWKVSAALPSLGVQPIDVPMLDIPPGHASGTVTLPASGDWQFSFTLRTTDFDQATVTTTVTIR